MTTSSLVRIDDTVPALAVKPLWKTTTASTCLNVGELALELGVDRHGAGDRAHRSRADAEALDRVDGARLQRRVVGQPEIVVRREIDDGAAVDDGAMRLFAGQLAQRAAQPLRAEGVEFGGQVGERVRAHARSIGAGAGPRDAAVCPSDGR